MNIEGPEAEAGPEEGPEIPSHLSREAIETNVGQSEWYGADDKAQEAYLSDLELGEVFDPSIMQSRIEEIAKRSGTKEQGSQFSKAAFEIAQERAAEGKTAAEVAVYLYFADYRARGKSASDSLAEKCTLLAKAHENTAARAKVKRGKVAKGVFRLSNKRARVYSLAGLNARKK